MNFSKIQKHQWKELQNIYLEAFPKAERKPFFVLKHSVKTGQAQILTAEENGSLIGFAMVIPYLDMVMVDYLAVSGTIRSRGTGSQLIQEVCRQFPDKKLVLLIEALDDHAENKEQRIARRRFYLKNGFTSSELFIHGSSGKMEVLNYGGTVSSTDYLNLQKYALGNLFFRLSGISLVA